MPLPKPQSQTTNENPTSLLSYSLLARFILLQQLDWANIPPQTKGIYLLILGKNIGGVTGKTGRSSKAVKQNEIVKWRKTDRQ